MAKSICSGQVTNERHTLRRQLSFVLLGTEVMECTLVSAEQTERKPSGGSHTNQASRCRKVLNVRWTPPRWGTQDRAQRSRADWLCEPPRPAARYAQDISNRGADLVGETGFVSSTVESRSLGRTLTAGCPSLRVCPTAAERGVKSRACRREP